MHASEFWAHVLQDGNCEVGSLICDFVEKS